MLAKDRINYRQHATKAYQTFAGIEVDIDQSDFDKMLRHLVKLRVSQINGCAFCVEMHTREARQDGETGPRLDMLVVWREVDLYSAAEKAALAWAEALTVLGNGASLDVLHTDLQSHFSDQDIATLGTVIVMINTWNRLQAAAHNSRF